MIKKENVSISIITVSYNAAKTILNTIDSISNQSYTNIEFLIIDGGSSDATLDIINAHKHKIDVIISEPDKGVYDAMNKGILRARGDWLLFMGADDVLFSSDTIEKAASELSRAKHLIYGDVIKVPEHDIYDGSFNHYKLIFKNICHQAIFFNKNTFKIIGLYDLNYKINSDWEFNLQCFQDSRIKIQHIPQVITYFNSQGLSSNTHDEAFENRKRQLIKSMPFWVKVCYKYRRTELVKKISKLFLNFEYA